MTYSIRNAAIRWHFMTFYGISFLLDGNSITRSISRHLRHIRNSNKDPNAYLENKGQVHRGKNWICTVRLTIIDYR